MNDQTDRQLLRDYARNRSEAAFAELVRRHIDLVYSAALRMVCDAHQAEDVTQGVFMALAQNAGKLTDHPVLSGWLHRTTQNLAANAVRANVRRQIREQEAAAMNELLAAEPHASWEQIAPHLDAALGELEEADRAAVLLRYFERKSAREMAQTLGISDEAAQKRVSRAVERLREFLAKRGVAVGASGLAVVLSVNAVQAAPVGLAATLSTTALAGTTLTAATVTATKTIAMTTLQKTLIAAVVVAGVTTSLLIQRQAKAKLDEQNNQFQQQSERMAQLNGENERLSRLATSGNDSMTKAQLAELEKLRAEAADLRSQSNNFAARHDESIRPQQPSVADAKTQMQFRELEWAKAQCINAWARAFQAYALGNQGQLPTSFEQAKFLWVKEIERYIGEGSGMNPDEFEKRYGTMADQFEITYRGSLDSVTNPEGVIVFREKHPWPHATGKWGKCFALIYPKSGPEPSLQYCSSTDKTANGNWVWFEKTHAAAPPGK